LQRGSPNKMAKVALRGVHKVTSRGKVYHYAWRGGPRLKGEPGSREYVLSLAEALETRRAPDKTRVAGLVTAYKASPAWHTDIGAGTRKTWAPWLDRIIEKFGPLPLTAFRRPEVAAQVEIWRDAIKAEPRKRGTGDRAADTAIQVMSRVMSYGKVTPNPCAGIGKLYSNNRADIIWTDEELTALKAHASKELMWAARLAALTGLRQDDCRRLRWDEISDLAIERVAKKSRTEKRYLIPMYGDLRKLLKEIPRRADEVLTNTHGKPWKSGLSDSFGDAARRAGIDKHFHDLRGTAATKLYLANFPLREIAEILAWEEDGVAKIINRYVRRDAMLRDRIARLDRTGTEPDV
jgi:integrase